MSFQRFQHAVGDGADAHLQRGAVLDQFRHERPDPARHRIDFRRVHLNQWLLRRHKMADVRDVEEAVAMGARHARIYLGDYRCGSLGGRLRHVYGYAQAAEAVGVRRRYLHQRNIETQDPVAEEPRYLRQEHRRKIGASGVDGFSRVRADEQRIVPKACRVLRPDVWGRALSVQMDDLDVAQLRRPSHQRLHQSLGDGAAALQIDALTRSDHR